MKIVVAHPGKQHVAALLEALAQRGWLLKFYSQFISNKLPELPWGRRVTKALRKFRYPESVPGKKLVHKPYYLAYGKLRGKLDKGHATYLRTFDKYDAWVANELDGLDYDVVIAYENSNSITFERAKRAGKVTILDLAQVHHEAIIELMSPVWPPATKQAELEIVNPRKAAALANTDYVFTLSNFARQTLLDRGWPAERVYQMSLGINPDMFNTSVTPPPNDVFTFLFVGSMELRKGLAELLESFAELTDAGMQAQLVLIGPPHDGQDLVDRHVAAYDNITYHAFMHHEDLVNQYRAADVYVLPSHLDSWAQTVIEAMACGTAALVSDRTGAQDAVVQGGGWVVPAADRLALRQQLLACSRAPAEVAAKGIEAAKIAGQYTWANYHRQLIEALESIASKENIAL